MHEKYDNLRVNTLDLFKEDLPAVAGQNIESKYTLMTGQALDETHASSWKQIEKNIERFLDADVYLLTVPMWNFGIPYALKYYIDAIVQPGYLFRYNDMGIPEGLVKGKKMICVTSRGGDYSHDPLKSFDFVESYLRTIFAFVGIIDNRFINVQPMDVTGEIRKNAIKNAIAEARRLVAELEWDVQSKVPEGTLPAGLKPAPLVTE
jgi:FMN-dependent NADH-azoreductase